MLRRRGGRRNNQAVVVVKRVCAAAQRLRYAVVAARPVANQNVNGRGLGRLPCVSHGAHWVPLAPMHPPPVPADGRRRRDDDRVAHPDRSALADPVFTDY